MDQSQQTNHNRPITTDQSQITMNREDFTYPWFTRICSGKPSLFGLPATTTAIANIGSIGDFVACTMEMMGVVLKTIPPELCIHNIMNPVPDIPIAVCLKELAQCSGVINYFFLLPRGIRDCTKYSDEEIRLSFQCIFNLLMSLAVKLDAIIEHGTVGKEKEYATHYLTKMLKQDQQQPQDQQPQDQDSDSDGTDDGTDDTGLLQRGPALPFPFYPERCLQYLQQIAASSH